MLANERQENGESEAVRTHNDPDSPFLNAPWKNMLMQALGAQADLQVDVSRHDVEPGDWLLLCSDGLYRVVKPEDMAAAFQSPATPAEKAQQLVALANQRGGPDNVSVVIAQVVQAN
jgi:protein phosphatase